jgi:hypothetical protein
LFLQDTHDTVDQELHALGRGNSELPIGVLRGILALGLSLNKAAAR